MSTDLTNHLASLPRDLGEALVSTLTQTIQHGVMLEWDDAQVDAGRFCEAALRYLEFKMTGEYTAIDGKQKPDRKKTLNLARNDSSLTEPSLRAQMPFAIELVMDFRNNRNSAHLGNIDANKMDGACVMQNVSWMAGEIARIESRRPVQEVQEALDRLAERHIPLIQAVGEDRVFLDDSFEAAERALVLLYREGKPVPVQTLRRWASYTNSSRWRTTVLKGLLKRKMIYIDGNDNVSLLWPGEAEAQRLLLDSAA
jgi:hypothetical protein